MKKILLFTLFFLTTISINPASAKSNSSRSEASIGHFFGAFGPLWGPGSFRIGHKSWELGLLGAGMVGINKNLQLSDNIYTSFGFGTMDGLAFFTAVGSEWNIFWKLDFRIEANTMASIENYHGINWLVGIQLAI
ncbi:MAG: hypothetical protein HOE90_24050 [Bacteriovoracaceae bacterium]|jgi:hypothetical protein|nr:hypothetical protein [Bacteriovoracaceae bacterium]